MDRIAGDYPRMVNLSHPQLRPEVMPRAIRYYSQHFVDALDLEQNTFTTVASRIRPGVRLPSSALAGFGG